MSTLPARLADFVDALGARASEPSYPALPALTASGETSIPGLFVVGEAAGTPLVKLGLNAGVALVDSLAERLAADARAATDDVVPLIVVGAGAAGLAAALRAHERGVRVRVLEAHELAHTVASMFEGKKLLAEPAAVKNQSALWFEECTREQLLARWREQIAQARLDVREHERVTEVTRADGVFHVVTSTGVHRARTVILALGKSGTPRALDVPGADTFAHRIHRALHLSSKLDGKDVVVVGGGDSACEAALALADRCRVTLVARGDLSAAKRRNADAVRARAAAGALTLRERATITQVRAEDVEVRTEDGALAVRADHVFALIGSEAPLAFFTKIGVRLEGAWDARRYLAALAVFLGVYTLYALKKFPEQPYSWPFHLWIPEAGFRAAVGQLFAIAFAPFAWLFTERALADIRATLWFQQGYLYSLAYTVVMAVFGWQALVRWTSKARDPRYQRYRYASLLAFQVVFFLVANVIAVQGLSVQHAWRAWGLYQPWPLFFHTFHWWNASDPRALVALFVGGGLVGTFVVIPLLARNHGKRFCTWVCGCGGLAETLGDRWRHLSPKGARSRAWEFQAFVVLLAAAVVTLVSVGAYGTRADNAWALAYSYVVDFWLVAVIPIALYPFFGGKIWCRYWCPLAAWNQILARLYGRLEIRANDQCITCGECSRYCQVGVDVMAFARKEQAFDNRNSSCIHCGICIDVCPMDVLSFAQRDVARPRGSLPILP